MDRTIKHILVTGSHRSGTTWVGKTISQHPIIKYIHEPFNVSHPNNAIGLKLYKWFTFAPTSIQKKDIEDSFDKLMFSTPLHRAIQASRVARLDAKFPLRFCKHLLMNLFIRHRFLIKDPIALLSAGWLHEMYDLQVVCMIRHPLGFVGSLKKAGWVPKTFTDFKDQEALMQSWLKPFKDRVNIFCEKPGDIIEHACLFWNILHFAIMDYQKRYSSWLFVKYEDIAMHPISVFQRIFDYLKLPMSDTIQRYILRYTSEKNPANAENTQYQPRNSKKNLDTWKERLTAQEIKQVMIATRDISAELYGDSV